MAYRFLKAALPGILAVAIAAAQSDRPALLLISIDGMRPDYVTKAEAHGLKIPHLKALMNGGSYATGVRGVLPTVTYPSHSTILTGVSPAEHGIYANLTFDPTGKNMGGWYWYSQDLQRPTLWQAAADGGLSVASVSWPVSVGMHWVQYLIPEVWRTQTREDIKLISALAKPPGLIEHLAPKSGPYVMDFAQPIPSDRGRTSYAVEIMREYHPNFVTVHLAALDDFQHATGPFSKESNAGIETLDSMTGELEDAMRAAHPNAAICVVSDHGFTKVDRHLHLLAAFADAGLVTFDPKTLAWPQPKVVDWMAMPWISGGSAAIVLKDPNDSATKAKVESLLKKLAADSSNGIAEVLDQSQIKRLGGAPVATFWLDMKSNFAIDATPSGPLVSAAEGGTHGYSPDNPDLLASFFLMGPRVKAKNNLGQIDMRSVAPTLAKVLGIKLTSAPLPALPVY